MYFAFIFAAINTLTVTYYLAIERYPFLQGIFPSFIIYVLIVTAIGIPLLILIGYIHFKRTAAHKSEIDISYETDPYKSRTLVNSEMSVKINLKLMEIILRNSQGEKISQKEIDEILKLKNELTDFIGKREFRDKKDLKFFNDKLDKFRI
ncbi:hypothetical protein [Nitrosopumilus adriaticus]|uniref:hypothetical protein n=1 Tax=Nitrosopumilus adriaticus TaxID=1580092 RepID=UPI00352CBCA5